MYDPSLTPAGKHIMGIFVQYAPYHLRESSWAAEKERFADRVVDALEAYAPGTKASILHRHCLSPLDLETEYGLTGGVISRDLNAALDVVSRVRSGIIHINDQGIGDEPMAQGEPGSPRLARSVLLRPLRLTRPMGCTGGR